MAGAIPILRFLYASEPVSYDWYPQNPLDRAKVDQFFAWYEVHKDKSTGLLPQASFKVVEDYFFGKT